MCVQVLVDTSGKLLCLQLVFNRFFIFGFCYSIFLCVVRLLSAVFFLGCRSFCIQVTCLLLFFAVMLISIYGDPGVADSDSTAASGSLFPNAVSISSCIVAAWLDPVGGTCPLQYVCQCVVFVYKGIC